MVFIPILVVYMSGLGYITNHVGYYWYLGLKHFGPCGVASGSNQGTGLVVYMGRYTKTLEIGRRWSILDFLREREREREREIVK